MRITRFAPSPTGYLHLGHAYAAWNAWRWAQDAGESGQFLLRIEDIDPGRCRPEYTVALLEDLRWLGLTWHGEVRVQSENMEGYAASLSSLAARGLLYPCFCTRAEIVREVSQSAHAPHGPDGIPIYPGICRTIPPAERARRVNAGEPHTLRLDMAAALSAVPGLLHYTEAGQGVVECHPGRFGDVVLARKDAPASYHLCVTHDDALQGVTLVTRAEDLRPVTDLHRLLQALMGWPAPDYAHHPLLRDANGKRLAKRDSAATIRDLREAGATPQDVWKKVEAAADASRHD